jgi:hypothetical protein
VIVHSLLNWVIAFSDTVTINVGTTQCTVSGPNNFEILINDLKFSVAYVKYAYDTTVYTISVNVDGISLQLTADDRVQWSQTNGLIINESKT